MWEIDDWKVLSTGCSNAWVFLFRGPIIGSILVILYLLSKSV